MSLDERRKFHAARDRVVRGRRPKKPRRTLSRERGDGEGPVLKAFGILAGAFCMIGYVAIKFLTV